MYVNMASRSYKTPSGVTTGSLHICSERLQQSKSPTYAYGEKNSENGPKPTESFESRLLADPKPEFSESFFLSA